MIIPAASLTKVLLLNTCRNAATNPVLFSLLFCHTELHFAQPAQYRCWLGPLLHLFWCWQGNQPRRLVLQAPSYVALPLELRPAHAHIMHQNWGYMGVGKWFLAYPVFLLRLWGVRFLPTSYVSDPPQSVNMYSCATTAPLIIPTRHAYLQPRACNYKVFQIYTLQSYTEPMKPLYPREIFTLLLQFCQYFHCSCVLNHIINDWQCCPFHLVTSFLMIF